MAKHYNSNLAESMLRFFRFKSNEQITSDVQEFIQPIIDVTPHLTYIDSAKSSSTGTTGMTSIGTSRIVRVSSLTFSVQKDATCDATSFQVNAFLANGFTKTIYDENLIASTAQTRTITLTFPRPLIVYSTCFSIVGTLTLGAMTKCISFCGSVEEI